MTLLSLKNEIEKSIEIIQESELKSEIEKAIVKPSNHKQRLLDINKNGFPKGFTTTIYNLDERIRFYTKQLYLMTGYSFEGKSHLSEQILDYLLVFNDIKSGYYSPEHSVDDFLIRQCTLLVGKTFEKITPQELDECFDFFENKIYSIDTDLKLLTFDELLDYTDWLVKNRNIQFMVVDNWASILSDYSDASQVKYAIARNLNILRGYAKQKNISFYLIAHPNKAPANRNFSKPIAGYDISGASEWQNFTDVGFTSHRDISTSSQMLYIWKVKQSYQGKVGEIEMYYEPETTRFFFNYNDRRNLLRINKTEIKQENNNDDVPF